jgi:hypothetical protein
MQREFTSYAKQLRDREDDITDHLPITDPKGVYKPILAAVERWGTEDRGLRTIPVLNVYQEVSASPISEEAQRMMTGLDAFVEAYSVLIRDDSLSAKRQANLALTIAYSQSYFFQHVPAEYEETICDGVAEYLTDVAQLAPIRETLTDQLRGATADAEAAIALRETYAQTARDIWLFADLPALLLDMDAERADRVRSDLLTFRARYLLYEDLRKIESSVEHQRTNPLAHLLSERDSASDVALLLDSVMDSFHYTQKGASEYGDLLEDLEERPEDVHESVREAMQLVED